jgi:hypothetical protein
VSASLLLTLITLYFLYLRAAPTARERATNVTVAALCNSVFTVAGLSAIFYPGSKGMDPEFGEGFPQGWIFAGLLVVNWVGWLVQKGVDGGKRE